MKQRETRKFLEDIQNAHRLLPEFTASKTFEDYAADRLLQSELRAEIDELLEKTD